MKKNEKIFFEKCQPFCGVSNVIFLANEKIKKWMPSDSGISFGWDPLYMMTSWDKYMDDFQGRRF